LVKSYTIPYFDNVCPHIGFLPEMNVLFAAAGMGMDTKDLSKYSPRANGRGQKGGAFSPRIGAADHLADSAADLAPLALGKRGIKKCLSGETILESLESYVCCWKTTSAELPGGRIP
jgi:hypothetical protein